ncbi:unnamed protein product [Prunus armeniaca]
MNFHTLIAKNGGRTTENEAGEVSIKTGAFLLVFRRNHGGWRRDLAGVGRGRRPGHFGTGPIDFGGRMSERPAKTLSATVAIAKTRGGRERRAGERECVRDGGSSVFLTKNLFQNIYNFATGDVLPVTSSLQLRFEPTTCLRTHLAVLYATVHPEFPNSFRDCIGAIDGTHIPAIVRGRDVSNYHNRHGNISQNVLAACNFDLEFMYVLSRWEGSAHDSKVLSDALSRRNGLKVPQGVRYHLQDFAGHGRDPENENELFNLRHASLRNVIERIFGIFKSRFTIFKSAPPFLFKTQAELVLTCASLHNFLRKECHSDEFPIEPTDESSSIPVDEEDNFELIYQTQDQQREDANTWRASIASAMWRDAI